MGVAAEQVTVCCELILCSRSVVTLNYVANGDFNVFSSFAGFCTLSITSSPACRAVGKKPLDNLQ